jgi:hypothetical protein
MCTVLLPPGVNPIGVNKIYHILQNLQTGSGAQPAFHSIGSRVLCENKAVVARNLTIPLNLVSRLRMSGVTLLLPLYSFTA